MILRRVLPSLGLLLLSVVAVPTASAQTDTAFLGPLSQRAANDLSRAFPNLAERRLVIAPINGDRDGRIREELIRVLANRTALAERQRVDLVFEEQKIQASSVIDQRTAARLGRLIGGDTVLYGRVREWTQYPGHLSFDLSLTASDVERGEVLWSESYQRSWWSPKIYWVAGGGVVGALFVFFMFGRFIRALRRPKQLQAEQRDVADEALSLSSRTFDRAQALERMCASRPDLFKVARELSGELRTIQDAVRHLPAGDPQKQKTPTLERGLQMRNDAIAKVEAMAAELDRLMEFSGDAFFVRVAEELPSLTRRAGSVAADLRSHPSTIR